MSKTEQETLTDGGQVAVERSAFTENGQVNQSDKFTDEFAAIADATVDDRTVKAEIWELTETEGGKIKMTARLPDGSKPSRKFQKPIPWSDEFALARLVEDRGYNPSSYTALEGDEILLRSKSDPGETPSELEWEFVIPGGGKMLDIAAQTGDLLKSGLLYSVVVGWPLYGAMIAYQMSPLLFGTWVMLVVFSLIALSEKSGEKNE